jgi:hypothetical protein
MAMVWAQEAHPVCPRRQMRCHRAVAKIAPGSLQCKKFFAWRELRTQLRLRTFGTGPVFPVPQTSCQHKAAAYLEATMELVVRLNVLAALLSFGFIAAIVFGVV